MSEWQLCPVCNGAGVVSGGYFMRGGDYDRWVSNSVFESCRVCDGKGIIQRPEEVTDEPKG